MQECRSTGVHESDACMEKVSAVLVLGLQVTSIKSESKRSGLTMSTCVRYRVASF